MSLRFTAIALAFPWMVGELCAQAIPSVDRPLVPETRAPGARGFMLTVNGCGFSVSSVVEWNGHPRPTVFVSASQLTALS